jgi:oxygen-independent coproporphyrinogen III oxidase
MMPTSFSKSLDPLEVRRLLEAVMTADARLRPTPELHDYQLTYPPAIQLERDEHRGAPSDEEFVRHAVGDFDNSALYFHFGFCRYKCRYCHHYELKTNAKADAMTRYVHAMVDEMRHFKRLTPQLRPLAYFLGGGTPTEIPFETMGFFLDALLQIFGRPRTALATVEVKPVTATREKLVALVAAGFRRINLGVQTLDPELYAFHHHKEEMEVALDAIALARDAGFQFINIDILTGIERQTEASWRTTLAAIEELASRGRVDSVFIYPYHDDPRSKTFANPGLLPSTAEISYSEALARRMFARLGWKELGARFFRAPRHVRRELFELLRMRANPSYGQLIYHGFGNSAFSVGDRATYVNHRDAGAYIAAVEARGLGISHWTLIDDAQRATRDLTFDLLYSPIVRVRSLVKRYGAENMASHLRELERWTALGLGRYNRVLGTWHLTEVGKLVHQEMLPALYLEGDRRGFDSAMRERLVAGRSYRGY